MKLKINQETKINFEADTSQCFSQSNQDSYSDQLMENNDEEDKVKLNLDLHILATINKSIEEVIAR